MPQPNPFDEAIIEKNKSVRNETSCSVWQRFCSYCSYLWSSLMFTMLVLAIIVWLFVPKQYQYNGTKIVFTLDKNDFLPQYVLKH